MGTVYFIQSATGHIKIGFTHSEHADSRLRGLQTAHPEPLTLLAECPGTWRKESNFHSLFKECRIVGTEWFHPSPELLAVIERIKAGDRIDEVRNKPGPKSPRLVQRLRAKFMSEPNRWWTIKELARAVGEKPDVVKTRMGYVVREWGVIRSANQQQFLWRGGS